MGWLGDENEKMIPQLQLVKCVVFEGAKITAQFLVLKQEKIVELEDEKLLALLFLVKHVKMLVSASLVKTSMVLLQHVNLMVQPFFF